MITETILSFSERAQCKNFLFLFFLTNVLKSLRERKEEGTITQRSVACSESLQPSGQRITGEIGVTWTLKPSFNGPAASTAASEPVSLLHCRHLRACCLATATVPVWLVPPTAECCWDCPITTPVHECWDTKAARARAQDRKLELFNFSWLPLSHQCFHWRSWQTPAHEQLWGCAVNRLPVPEESGIGENRSDRQQRDTQDCIYTTYYTVVGT